MKNANPQSLKLAKRLDDAGRRTQEFFQSVERDQWHLQVYVEGANWTVRHILAHFLVTESSVARLIQYILDGLPGVPEDFDVDRFNEREVNCLMKLPVEYVLERFMVRRAEMIQLVSELQDTDLDREGRHPWLGNAPIREMIKLVYRHNQIHQRDIRKILNS